MNKKIMKKELLIFFILILAAAPLINAEDHVISNSEKWTDVFSTIHYANLKGIGSDFLVSTKHGPLLLNDIAKSNSMRILTSSDRPYVFNYEGQVSSAGFAEVEEITLDNFNIELIKDLPEINNFVITGDAFGYNALAATPYAIKNRAWIFLANNDNIFEIDSVLSERNINKIIIYGFVDREVEETLSKYNPKIINTGDRFQDNIEIVKEYLKINPITQVILTNGEFIEKEIMSGTNPVLFTGKQNVPPKISDYLKNSDIEIGVLIGNDLVGAAQNIKESTGVYVMVKFARSARSPEGGVSAVEGLDLFPVPTPNMQLILHSAKYNQASSQLEITYQSKSNIPIYFKGTITVIVDGETRKVGDLDPIFLAPGDYKTVSYSLELTSLDNIEADIYTLYGETPEALDRAISARISISTINVLDSCVLELEDIKSVKYSKQNQEIIVKIKNPHNIDCWVDLEILDLIIGNSKKTIGTDGSTRITAGNTRKISISQELTDTDLKNNQFVEMVVLSGEREDSLVHSLKHKFELQVESLTLLTYAIIALVVLIILLIIVIIIIKKRQEEYY